MFFTLTYVCIVISSIILNIILIVVRSSPISVQALFDIRGLYHKVNNPNVNIEPLILSHEYFYYI